MSALLFSTAMIIFLIGLVSEQITSLIYNNQTTINTNEINKEFYHKIEKEIL
jgi:hypothetical protein